MWLRRRVRRLQRGSASPAGVSLALRRWLGPRPGVGRPRASELCLSWPWLWIEKLLLLFCSVLKNGDYLSHVQRAGAATTSVFLPSRLRSPGQLAGSAPCS